ncbi:hypothetical protein IKG48_01630 [Candidatus Saccharibacteria bacterium]|nr:hypothetical protein [Candidatus Saccharibacteria bacterium]
MDEEIINKMVRAIPSEGLQELNSLLDTDFDEGQIRDLLKKYNVNLSEVLIGKETV